MDLRFVFDGLCCPGRSGIVEIPVRGELVEPRFSRAKHTTGNLDIVPRAWFDKLTTNGIFDKLTTNGIFDKLTTNGFLATLTSKGVNHSYPA